MRSAQRAWSCIAVLLAGCGSSGSDAAPSDGGILDVATDSASTDGLADAKRDAPPPPPEDPLEPQRLACAFHAGALAKDTVTGFPSPSPLKHVLVFVQENRSFDHLLGRHPRVATGEVDGFPDTYVNVALGGATYPPIHAETSCISPDPPHFWDAMHGAWNEGKNDHFYIEMAKFGPGKTAIQYYAPEDVPFYTWLYGDTFAISDRYFAPVLGPTAPNRSFLYAGTSGGGKDEVTGVTKFVFTELETAGIDWRVYGGATYGGSLATPPPAHARNLVQLTADLASGDLGQVAFVSAEFDDSEHPPLDLHAGEQWVHDFVVALAQSPAWSSTALFITYDETGGFFEHVPPPSACPPDATAANAVFDRYGFRVPFVVVSPFARKGYVSHRVHSHTSITRFIEASFGLPALTDRDANSDALLDLFDFGAPPSAPPDVATIPAAIPPTCAPPPP